MENKDENKNKITGYCVPVKLFYPKETSFQDFVPGTFGILQVDISKVIEGNLPAGFSQNGWFSTISIKGILPPLEKDENYYF